MKFVLKKKKFFFLKTKRNLDSLNQKTSKGKKKINKKKRMNKGSCATKKKSY